MFSNENKTCLEGCSRNLYHSRMGAWVYTLRCSDGSFYVGLTRYDEPETRAWEHNQGGDRNAYTFKRRPVELVWSKHFDLVTDAISCERRLKGWRREKKLAVISRDYATLKGLGSRAISPAAD